MNLKIQSGKQSSQQIKNMTEEEILKEAKRRYPIGTKFKGIDAKGNKNNFISTISMNISCYKDTIHGILAYGHTQYYCYADGKWAERISKSYEIYY